ncbi:MAG: TIM barrel protein [Candidatus Diapherotrites archaeon]|nr:TIM barrel protein [Candidatus Diapherotrites archaeon]
MVDMEKLMFGTAGIPLSAKPYNTIEGIKKVRALGLEAMELEFVRNINVSENSAPDVKKTAESNDIVLTCHASYFINLNSAENAKQEASVERLKKGAIRAYECGAFSICFHAGFYQNKTPAETYKKIRVELENIVEFLKNSGAKIWLRPETTGKSSQFGSLDEILSLSSEIDGVMPCVDFSHMHARNGGKINSYKEFVEVLEKIEKALGRMALNKMHIHVSGIEYTDKGERNHLNLPESDLNYKDLLKALKDFNCKGVIISESPNIELDAMLMKKTYEKL